MIGLSKDRVEKVSRIGLSKDRVEKVSRIGLSKDRVEKVSRIGLSKDRAARVEKGLKDDGKGYDWNWTSMKGLSKDRQRHLLFREQWVYTSIVC